MAAASGFVLAWEELLMTSFCMAATLNGFEETLCDGGELWSGSAMQLSK